MSHDRRHVLPHPILFFFLACGVVSMSSDIFWFLPTSGDGRHIGRVHDGRPATNAYMRRIAEIAEDLGYDGLLIPTGSACLDPWVTAASLAAVTRRIRLLVALRTALGNPTASARQAITLDEALGAGRLLLNIVAGGDPAEMEADGIFLDHDERYAATDEFLTIWRGIMAGKKVDFAGRHLRVKGAERFHAPVSTPHPPLFIGGSSPAAHEVAARHVQTYLTWGEPVDAVRQKIADVRERAARLGRTVSFGVRLHVVVRETEEQARTAAEELIRHVDGDTIARAGRNAARMDSEGQRRMWALHEGRREKLEIAPNLWAGVGLVRGGAGTALVGAPENIAARIREYEEAGVSHFIFSGYPHLEESIRFAELVFPLLPGRQPVTVSGQNVTGGAFDGRA